jgi:hypothetical protein
MLLLASTSDLLQLVTGSAVTVDVHASYVDLSGSTVTPGRKNTAITTAATTSIVLSPAAATTRNVQFITIRNKHATLSNVVTVRHTDGTTIVELFKDTLGPGAELIFSEETGFFITRQAIAEPDNWHGVLYGAYGRCDPQQLLRMAQMAGTVAATPTAITTSLARIAYFRPPADIIVNRIRYFGVGATTNVYRCAIYNGDTLARLTAELAFSTTAQTWAAAGSGLNLTLLKDQLYFIAVSVNATGTVAGPLCMSPTIADTTGRIGVLPKAWPGSLTLDSGFMDGGFAQFAVTTGALPNPAATIALQTAWTGGMPLFFLDNNNA